MALNVRITADTAQFERGMRRARSRLGALDAQFERTRKQVTRFGAALIAAIGAQRVAGEFVRMADAATRMENRLKTVTDSAVELQRAQQGLFDIAQKTRTSIEATTELYARMSAGADELGLSQDQLLQVTENINKVIAMSGISAAEAAGGLRQLAQGLGTGVLRGEELNSVMENMRPIAKIIADEFGTTVGKLKILGEQGKLAADRIAGALLRATDQIDANFKNTAATTEQSMTRLENALIKTTKAIVDQTGVAKLWKSALEGATDAAEGLAEAITPDTAFEALEKTNDQIKRLREELEQLDKRRDRPRPLLGINPDLGRRGDIMRQIALLERRRAALSAEAQGEDIAGAMALPSPSGLIEQARKAEQARVAAAQAANAAIEQAHAKHLERLTQGRVDAFLARQDIAAEQLQGFMDRLMTEEDLENEQHERRIEQLKEFRELYLISEQEFYDALASLVSQHEMRIADIQARSEQRRKAKKIRVLKEEHQAVLDNLTAVTAAVSTHNKEMFRLNQAFAIAQAIISTAQGAAQALRDIPYPWNLAAAATVIAAGGVQIATIANQKFNGGGSAGGAVAPSAAATPAPPVTPVGGSSVNVTFQGDSVSKDQLRDLFDLINEGLADGHRINLQTI